MPENLHHVSLFSGIPLGGFELAMAEAGIPTIAACEIDKKARGVLHDRFPGVHIYHDVRKVTGDSLRSIGAVPGRTVLTAGWPCQGNSVAGSRGGMDDARSGLWSEVVRILAELRPAWFVGENVPGLLSVAGGRDFATVVGDLARLGYGFAWRVLDAQHFGVPQRRRRVVIVGRLGDSGRAPAQVLLEPEGGVRNPAEGIAPRQVFARRAAEGAGERRLAPTLTASYGEQTQKDFDAFAPNGAMVVGVTGTRSHALTADGSDASEDGTGRGTPIVAYAADTVGTLDTARGGPDDNSAQAAPSSRPRSANATRCPVPEVSSRDYIAFSENQRGEVVSKPIMGALKTGGGKPGQGYPAITDGTIVRRLTPLETCRLQGYPDGHTATSDGQPQADGPQYRQHGNGIAVPMFAWVAKRIAAVDREAAV